MSVFHVCDGCDKRIEAPVQSGSVLTRDYCEDCAKIAEEFLELEEKLRVDLVGKFNTRRLKLIQKFSKDNFMLPDVVYDNTGPDKS